jgi:hypothetical protein
MDVLTYLVPSMISIAVFGLYVGIGNTLTSSTAFSVLALFNLL